MLPYQTNETLLKVEGISKKYDVPVLRDISLEVKNVTRPDVLQGQIISLVGKSGSGKSTLFRILAGLEQPDTGSVQTFNRDTRENAPSFLPVKEGDMGVVFQNSYIYPWRRVKTLLNMAVRKNPELGKYQSHDKNSVVETMVAQMAELFSLEDHLNKYANQLSGGQRQRVAIAEQLLNGGDFILMDEPFSGLDTLTIDKVTSTLIKVSQTDDKKTIVLVSHDLSNSLAISDTAFILAREEGKEGATITHQICLATQGLAWQPDIKENPLFRDLLKHVKSLL